VAWEWNYEYERWNKLKKDDIRPGMTLLLASSLGGYDAELGWTANKNQSSVKPLELEHKVQDSLEHDELNYTTFCTIDEHSRKMQEVIEEVIKEIFQEIEKDDKEIKEILDEVKLAALWYDIGKNHKKWQEKASDYIKEIRNKIEKILSSSNITEVESECLKSILSKLEKPSEPIAKFPDVISYISSEQKLSVELKERIKSELNIRFRPGIRHEASSALLGWNKWVNGEKGWTPLAVYLIATHHGKVRTILRGIKEDNDDVFGIKDGDVIPAIKNWLNDDVRLETYMKYFGAKGEWSEDCTKYKMKTISWVEMVDNLIDKYGPLKLAFLESIIRACDMRASSIEVNK